MSTDLIAEAPSLDGAMILASGNSFYDRFQKPMEAIQTLGKMIAKSGMVGCDTEYEGCMVAFQCLAEKVTPLEFGRKYHVIKGNITKKAVVQYAEFRALGGRYKFLNTGEDGVEAVAEFIYEGETSVWKYTMEEAKRAGLGKKEDSNWKKTPGSMLRARLGTKAFTAICPEIVGGFAPEGIDEDIEASTSSTAATPTRTREEVAARAAELRAQSETVAEAKPAASTEAAADPDVVDAEFTPTATAKVEESAKPVPEAKPEAAKEKSAEKPAVDKPVGEKKPAYTTGDGSVVGMDQLKQLAALCEKLGITKQEFVKKTCEECDIAKIQDLKWVQAAKLISNLEAQVAAKK